MAAYITIQQAPGRWSVRAGGVVLGASDKALELREGRYRPVIYFPRDDIDMSLLERTPKSTHCPHKGDAGYFSILIRPQILENAVWTYETPLEPVAEIRGHLAFYTGDDVSVAQI